MVVVANAPDTGLDLFTLRSEPLVLTAGRVEHLLGLLQAHGILWGTARAALCGLMTSALREGLQPFELLLGFGDGFMGSSLFGRRGTRNRFDQLVLHMKQVRRVVRLERVFHIGQQTGRFITGRLDHPAVELCQGRCHPLIPADLITGLSQLFQNNEIALRVHRDEAKAASKRFVLGHREVFWGHVLGQACCFILAIVHHRLLNLDIDLLLSPIGSRDKTLKAAQAEKETSQANATGPDFNAGHMERNHDRCKNARPGPL